MLVILAKRQAGDNVKLQILRDRKTLELDVLLARRDKIFSRSPAPFAAGTTLPNCSCSVDFALRAKGCGIAGGRI
ncbi:MAG: hypothetical protein HC845_02490 [Akkermansiaceae bacterium]|nr:hypothetical protein [Akkermansiaceae bacterium]